MDSSDDENLGGAKQTGRLSESVNDAEDYWRGTENALVTIVCYGDFGCAAGGAAHSVWREVERGAAKSVRYVFRYFPLESAGSQSFKAAEAAEAAGRQGKFWEMHDSLFARQDKLDDASLVKRAAQLDLNVEQFLRDIADGACVAKIRRDLRSGAASGVARAPTYFINGVIYKDALRADALLAAVNNW